MEKENFKTENVVQKSLSAREAFAKNLEKLPSPEEICKFLDEYVIDQDEAKKVLSVAVYNHYKRIRYHDSVEGKAGLEIDKSNIMMIGPTGSGKTYLASTLAKILKVPIAIADATNLLASANIVIGIEAILQKLVYSANGDMYSAERGIIYIDEIDKLVAGDNRLRGQAVQQALLKVLEKSRVPIRVNGKPTEIDTTNILFIVGGAFVNLANIIKVRMLDTKLGLLSENELLKHLATADLVRFGFIPEFIGRIPVCVLLEELSIEALMSALYKPKNSLIEQYKKMFELDNVELDFKEESYRAIAEKAASLKTGARGLRTVVENSMRDIMYSAAGKKNLKKVIITPDVIKSGAKPVLDFVQANDEEELVPLTPIPPQQTYVDWFKN